MRTKLKQKKRTKSYPTSTTTTAKTTKAASKTRTTTTTTTRRKPPKRLRKTRKTSANLAGASTSSTTSSNASGAAVSNHQANVATGAVATLNHPHQELLDKETLEKAILKYKLKKATIKFEKACKQLLLLDQKINDLQNSYTSSMETDRKTFKIVNRMQLATLEGTHEAYIEYIERKVDEIRQLKYKIFGNDNESTATNNTSNSSSSSSNTDNSNLGASTSNDTNSRPLLS